MTDGISLEDAVGGAPAQRQAVARGIPLEDVAPPKDITPRRTGWEPLTDYLKKSAVSLGEATALMGSDPLKTAVSGGKAIGKGIYQGLESLGTMLGEGIAGIATWTKDVADGKPPSADSFMKGKDFMEDYLNQTDNSSPKAEAKHGVVQHIINAVNTVSSDRTEAAVGQLLQILPEGVTAVGDTVFEKTGSAFWGAGTQGVLAFTMLRGDIIADAMQGVKGAVRGTSKTPEAKAAGDKVLGAFEELAQKKPDAAAEIIRKAREKDTDLADLLEEKASSAQKKEPEVIGKEAAERALRVPRRPAPVPGKPHITMKAEVVPTVEQLGAGVRAAVKDGHDSLTDLDEYRQRVADRAKGRYTAETFADDVAAGRVPMPKPETLRKRSPWYGTGRTQEMADVPTTIDVVKGVRGEFESKYPLPKELQYVAPEKPLSFEEGLAAAQKRTKARKDYEAGLTPEFKAAREAYRNESMYHVYQNDGFGSKPLKSFATKEMAEAYAAKVRKATPARAVPKDDLPATGILGLSMPWNKLHHNITPLWDLFGKAADQGKSMNSHAVLDYLIKNSEEGIVQDLLTQIRGAIPKIDVVPKKGALSAEGKPFPNAGGLYLYATKDTPAHIQILVEKNLAPANTRFLVHEMVHAVTSDFLMRYPSHPLSKRIVQLREIAKDRMIALADEFKKENPDYIYPSGGMTDIKTGKERPWGTMYGVTDAHELMAEVKTNPGFQKLLVRSEKFVKAWHKLDSVVTRIGNTIAEILGVKKPESVALLHNILDTTDKIIARQKEMREAGEASASQIKARPAMADEPLFKDDEGRPVTRPMIEKAFEFGGKVFNQPGIRIAKGKLEGYYKSVVQLLNPELLGEKAKLAAAVLAKNIAEQMQKDTQFFTRAKTRRGFWNTLHKDDQLGFLWGFENGFEIVDPMWKKAAEGYKEWNNQIYHQDNGLGVVYDPVDNYLTHIFENGDEVAGYFARKFGPKWNNPYFIKDRSFTMYDEAIKAGYKPKYTNPEDIMLARQHASDVAQMRIQSLRDMETYGLAQKIPKGGETPHTRPGDLPAIEYRAPNGDRYWVDSKAGAVLYNAFDTRSLWTAKNPIVRDTFKGAMFLKNTMVPIKLALSLFHPLHVATIDNATGMTRASKEMLAGKINPVQWLGQMAKSGVYLDLFKETAGTLPGVNMKSSGNRMLRVYQGKVPDAMLSEAERTSLMYMSEGGFIPEMSAQFKTKAIQSFTDAVQRHSATAVWHAPFAAISLMGKPLFEVWIPSLKIASYLKDIETAMTVNPRLVDHPGERMMAFRKIAKSVDNRYGEMAYNTLFMNRTVKDLAVANTLSLGWQMGFIREYGGGAMDLTKAVSQTGSVATKAKLGMLDRPLFTTFYTTQALMYGSLLTFALAGTQPGRDFRQWLMDAIYPKTGKKDAAGNDERVNTMFYTREFMSTYKHMQEQGVIGGLGQLAASKSSGVVGMVAEWATGVNSWGEEIRDPYGTKVQQIAQTLASTMADLEPISVAATDKGTGNLLAYAGFTPAPKYITEPETESAIKSTYQKYYAPKETPYERAQYSADARKLRTAHERDDAEGYSKISADMQEKYQLTGAEMRKLEKSANRGSDPTLRMFERFDWKQQKRILDKMTPEEREHYLPHSNKEHLRNKYEAPEEVE